MKKTIGIFIALAIFLAILLFPQIDGLPPSGQRCLAIFVLIFILYIFESIQAAVISLAIVPLLVIFNVADIKSALSGFSSTSTYLIIGSYILARAMSKSQLDKRLTYYIILFVGTKARNISFAIMIVNIIMAFLIPSSTARTVVLLPIFLYMINQFRGNGKEKTKFGSNLLLTLCVTNSTISAGILTSTISNPMAVEYIVESTGRSVSFQIGRAHV